MSRHLSLIALSCFVAFLLFACSSDQPAPVDDNQAIRIGVNAEFEPFEFIDSSGQLIGFDVDLMAEICRRNEWEYEFVQMPFRELLPAVTRREIDVAISAISVTPVREATVRFSDPYYLSWQAITVPSTDTLTSKLEDLRAKRVGVLGGSTSEYVAKSSDGLLVFPFTTVDEAFAALKDGQVDAVLNDYSTTQRITTGNPALRTVDNHSLLELYGIAMPLTATDLHEQVNRGLAELMGEGVIDSLHRKWFDKPLFPEDARRPGGSSSPNSDN